MQIIQVLFVAFAVFGAVASLDLPDGLTACKQDDGKCLETAFNQFVKIFATGSKEYGIPQLDPLTMTSILIPGNGGTIDLEQAYDHVKLIGLSDIVAKSITAKISDSECAMDVMAYAEDLELLGHYRAVGKMLLFTINGEGASNLTLKHTNVHFDIGCEINERDGDKYLSVNKFKVNFLDTKMYIDYENLVNGNPELSATVLKAMNENSEDVFKYLKDDNSHVYADIFSKVANAFFEKVPLSKLGLI